MSAPRRVLRHPSLTRRVIATGSLVGVGMLAATAAAPAAQAVPASGDPDQSQQAADPATAGQPLQDPPPPVEVGDGVALGGNFGTGKDFQVRLAPVGEAPGDLDLSGVTFTLRADDGTTHDCTTDAQGVCTFVTPEEATAQMIFGGGGFPVPGGPPVPSTPVTEENQLVVPDGTYTVVRAGTVQGLDPAAGTVGDLGTVTLGSGGDGLQDGSIPDVSLFRRSVVATVTDAGTGAPVPGAVYDLTGPDYRHSPAVTGTTRDAGTETTGTDGAATWSNNWFLPGTWTLTPASTPAGYLTDTAWTTVITTADGEAAAPWKAEHTMVPGSGNSGTNGSSATTPATTPATTSAPAPVAPVATSAAPRPRHTVPVPPAPVAPSSAAAPQPAGDSAAAATTDAPSATESAPATPSPLAEPRLRTVSRSVPESALVGIGILFVVVVLFAVLIVRRRARRG